MPNKSLLVLCALPLAIGQLPSPSHLTHVSQITEVPPSFQLADTSNHRPATSVLDSGPTFTNHQHKHSDVIYIGAALPPISGKLVKRVEQGSFIEMAELLPESLGHLTIDDDQPATPKPRRRAISDIVEWLQCFGTYIAIVSRKQPARVLDLLGYQSLIIQAYQEYRGDCWLGYDCRFRQQAAATPSISWAIADSTLWNIAFSGRATVSCCSHCFSLSHHSDDCEAFPTISIPREKSSYKTQPQLTNHYRERNSSGSHPLTTRHPRFMQPVCYSFNDSRMSTSQLPI